MKQPSLQTNTVLLKPYSVKELSGFYGVGKKTFGKWIFKYKDEIGEKLGHFYTVAQVKIIFEKFGVPGVLLQ